MEKNILFVGSVKLEVLKYFRSNDWNCGLLQPVMSNTDKTPVSLFDHQEEKEELLNFIFPINTSSLDTLTTSLKGLFVNKNTVLYSDEDRHLLTRARASKILGIRTNEFLTEETAIQLTSKFAQRAVFEKECPEITVPYKKVKTFHGAYMFTRKYGFPIIVKPVHLSQSQLVEVCYDLEELISKVSYIFSNIEKAYERNEISRSPAVLVEKYIEGKQYSVDSYVDLDGNVIHTPICQQTTANDIGLGGFETVYSGYPSELTKQQEKEVYECVDKSIKALKITGNPTHIEVKITDEGEVKIIEANLRIGGLRSMLLGEAYGIDHLKNSIKVVLGEKIEKLPTKLVFNTISPQIWPEKVGILKSVEGVEEVRKLKSYISDYTYNKYVGKQAGPAEKGYPRIFFAILANKDKKQLNKDRDFVLEKVVPVVN